MRWDVIGVILGVGAPRQNLICGDNIVVRSATKHTIVRLNMCKYIKRVCGVNLRSCGELFKFEGVRGRAKIKMVGFDVHRVSSRYIHHDSCFFILCSTTKAWICRRQRRLYVRN